MYGDFPSRMLILPRVILQVFPHHHLRKPLSTNEIRP